jgi:DNA-directed RNA polymerase subunit RPC12/RpoP
MKQGIFIIYKCLRCGWEWGSRREEKPTRCAKCKNPYWDKERQSEVKDGSNH